MNARIGFATLALIAAMPAFAQTAKTAKTAQNVQSAAADAMFAAWDKDGNGSVSKEEFRAGYADTRNAMATQRLRVEFQRHDADKSGKLEAGEYAKLALVQRAGKQAPMLSAFDRDKNQGLDFAEYLDFVRTAAQTGGPAPATAAKTR